MENAYAEKRIETVNKIKAVLEENGDFDSLARVLDEKWPKEVYTITKLDATTKAATTGYQGDYAILMDPINMQGNKMVEKLMLKYNGLAELVRRNEGEVDFLIQTARTKTRICEQEETTSAVYLVPMKIDQSGVNDMEEVYNRMEDLIKNLNVHPTEKINMVIGDGLKVGYIRKIFVFVSTSPVQRKVSINDNEGSAGGHYQSISISSEGHEDFGGGNFPFSAGSGLKAIAEGSAQQATNAAANQHTAAKQAAFTAKSSLAQAAAGAAATAQAALIGKQILINKLEQDANEAQQALHGELQQLEQAKRSADAAQQAASLAQQQINALGAAANAAQGTLIHAQQAAEEAHAELGSQQAMVGAAKQRLSVLSHELEAARNDLHETEAAAQNAQTAAHIAQSNAANAAESASAAAVESDALVGSNDHGFSSESNGGYHH
ncbi:hypothetical protein MML48_2g00020372 [Holotrichia oblita]|uniref:Uncharacterized protein n=1 Tax=Holotrichia oblita TaxID=644536 RepID=A0ACB9TLU3_HOLOL|nr:hypothetical protein MML48_2g00020372 [Holotrichia oblita]